MSIYAEITATMNRIADELHRTQAAEGLPDLLLTGRIEVDAHAERIWFEVLDDGRFAVTSWVTADAPQLAACGETLCAAASLDEAMMLGQD